VGGKVPFEVRPLTIVKLLEIGMVAPPVGMNVYVIKGSLGNLVTFAQVFRGVGWFILTDTVTLAVLILFPVLSLWLPTLMLG
jgi:C4-dicarboxylate transporter, DctM subunit